VVCKDCPYDQDSIADPYRSERRNHSRKKKRNKRERELKYRQHLREMCGYSCWGGAMYVEDTHKPYYRRYYRGSHNNRFAYHLRRANEKVRRYEGEIHKGSMISGGILIRLGQIPPALFFCPAFSPVIHQNK